MNTALAFTKVETPIGNLTLVASPKALVKVLWEGEAFDEPATKAKQHPILEKAKRQVQEYFSGKRKKFDLPLDFQGTPFQVKAWKALQEIPYGSTICYSEQASWIGDRKKSRAVGAANGKNPICIIVPCHRVIGKDGNLRGFGGGLKVKRYLLDLETSSTLHSR